MKVARNTTHNLRHDWLSFSADKGRIEVSLLACRNVIAIDVAVNGVRHQDYWSPHYLVNVLLAAMPKEGAE